MDNPVENNIRNNYRKKSTSFPQDILQSPLVENKISHSSDSRNMLISLLKSFWQDL